MSRCASGVTLVELLLASVLGLVVLLGIGKIDVARITMGHDIRGFSIAQMEAGYGLSHMSKQLEGADRINLRDANCAAVVVTGSCLQFRVPTGTDFDNPANYVWRQYKHDVGVREIRFYDASTPCPAQPDVIFRDIDTLTIAKAPASNNELAVAIASTPTGASRTTTYTGEVTIRGGGFDVATGLAPSGVSEPPPACP